MGDAEPALARPPRVAVLIDLYPDVGAGGHVKVWLRWADALAKRPDLADLTLFFLGDTAGEERIADHVRMVMLPPVKGTRARAWLRNGAGDTDLARHHPALADRLVGMDIVHATDTFAFGQTAKRIAARPDGPIFVASLHTDLETLTPIYAREIVGRLLGGPATRALFALGLGHGLGAHARRKTVRFHRGAAHLFLAPGRPWDALRADFRPDQLTDLRRGVDRDLFNAGRRDTAWLRDRFAIPEGRRVLLFAGRVDASKNAPLAAEATARAIAAGHDIHLLVLGRGNAQATIAEALGDRASVAGPVDQDTVARAMASSDLFLFPSRSDTAANVVQEALASGLPVLVNAADGGVQHLTPDLGQGRQVAGPDGETAWGTALIDLLNDPATLPRMAQAARAWADTHAPSWADVLSEDLVPVWHRLAARGRQGPFG